MTDHVKEMYTRFMADLPKAENQRFASPAVAEALDNALAGVAAGGLRLRNRKLHSLRFRPRPTRLSGGSEFPRSSQGAHSAFAS